MLHFSWVADPSWLIKQSNSLLLKSYIVWPWSVLNFHIQVINYMLEGWILQIYLFTTSYLNLIHKVEIIIIIMYALFVLRIYKKVKLQEQVNKWFDTILLLDFMHFFLKKKFWYVCSDFIWILYFKISTELHICLIKS